jgi:hypothetical protein
LLLPQSESGRHGAYAVLRFVEQVDHPPCLVEFFAEITTAASELRFESTYVASQGLILIPRTENPEPNRLTLHAIDRGELVVDDRFL